MAGQDQAGMYKLNKYCTSNLFPSAASECKNRSEGKGHCYSSFSRHSCKKLRLVAAVLENPWYDTVQAVFLIMTCLPVCARCSGSAQ